MSRTSPKSILVSIIGWVIAAFVVFWLLGVVIGTIRLLVRMIVWIVLLGLLLTAYFNLREPD